MAEWATLGLSILLVLGLVGTVASQELRGQRRPAEVAADADLGATRAQEGRFHVPVRVVNGGDEPAEDVQVVLTLTAAGSSEEAELRIVFLAGGAQAEGTAAFGSDPRAGELRVEVRSFLRP